MSKHTPKPWFAHYNTVETALNLRVTDARGKIVCEFPDPIYANAKNGIKSESESKANAVLISIAPAMFGAIESALNEFREKECNCDGEVVDGRTVGHACYFHRIEEMLRETIAKVTGDKCR